VSTLPVELARARVLLVDDSPIALGVLSTDLEALGYQVQCATNGLEAVGLFELHRADVVVTDVTMPDMSGIELLARIKREAPDTPVVMISLDTQLDTVLAAVRRGAFDYVLKDGNTSALSAAVRRAVEVVELRRKNAALVDELQEANEILEQRVAQRVQMLEETNKRLNHERQKLHDTLEQLSEMQSQLLHAEKMATLGLLTAGVAHEINRPLSFVLPNFSLLQRWCESLLRGEPGTDILSLGDVLDVLGQMIDALMRIRDIVHDLGLFSRRGAGVREKVALEDVVDSVLRLFGSQVRERARVELTLQDIPSVAGDPAQLRHVFLSLLVDAVQALDPARGEGLIRIEARGAGSYVEVGLTHTGRSLDQKVVDRILNPALSGDLATQDAHAGLRVSRHLVERMGGMVSLDAERQGATGIVVRLPRWIEREQISVDFGPRQSRTMRIEPPK
jgi:C4-dicarboxylate-specific signal transduction histidine kinase